jgi:hypothetical protein
MTEIESDRISEALERALETGDTRTFFDRVERASGLPGKRPNLPVLRAVGARLATSGDAGEALLEELVDAKHPALYRVAFFGIATRAAKKGDRTKAFERLHDLADEPVHDRRVALIDALADVVGQLGDPAVERMAAFTDGFLHAHVALEVISRDDVLPRLSKAGPVLARFTEAFELADAAPRSSDRSQGLRVLRAGLPIQIAKVAPRFGEIVDWVRERTARERRETREVIAEAVSGLRKIVGEAEATRLRAEIEKTRPHMYDENRIVHGTRNRSRGKK